MTKPAPRLGATGTKSKNVPRTGAKNHELRTREYLTEGEVEALIAACKRARWPHRDATMILLAFRHGLRALELVDLEWTQIDFGAGTILVKRRKNGSPSTHPLTGRELRALRRLRRETETKSPFIFVSERGSPMTASNFQKIVSRACEDAGLEIKAHPHHASGMAADTRWRAPERTPEVFRLTSGTRISNTRSDTPRSRRSASRAGGAIEEGAMASAGVPLGHYRTGHPPSIANLPGHCRHRRALC
jgi:integrase